MRLEYCGVHDDCQIVDNVHTPKRAATAETFPDWPVTESEYKRGTPDSELMPRLETLEAEVRGAVELVDAFGPAVETTQGTLKSFLDRTDKLVRELTSVERTTGLSKKAAQQLQTLTANAERSTTDWAAFVATFAEHIREVRQQVEAVAVRLSERTRHEIVELRAEQAAQADALRQLTAQVADYAAAVPDSALASNLSAIPEQVKVTAEAVVALGDRLTTFEQRWEAHLDRFEQVVERLERRNATIEGIADRTLDAANAVRGELTGQIDAFHKLQAEIVGPERLQEREKLEDELAEFQRLFKEALRVRSASGVA